MLPRHISTLPTSDRISQIKPRLPHLKKGGGVLLPD